MNGSRFLGSTHERTEIWNIRILLTNLQILFKNCIIFSFLVDISSNIGVQWVNEWVCVGAMVCQFISFDELSSTFHLIAHICFTFMATNSTIKLKIAKLPFTYALILHPLAAFIWWLLNGCSAYMFSIHSFNSSKLPSNNSQLSFFINWQQPTQHTRSIWWFFFFFLLVVVVPFHLISTEIGDSFNIQHFHTYLQ